MGRQTYTSPSPPLSTHSQLLLRRPRGERLCLHERDVVKLYAELCDGGLVLLLVLLLVLVLLVLLLVLLFRLALHAERWPVQLV